MRSFQDSIEKLLWPEKRERDRERPGGAGVGLADFQVRLEDRDLRLPGVIDRTTTRSYFRVAAGYLPESLRHWYDSLKRVFPWLLGEEGLEIGPIPAGTPVNLLANLSLISESGDTVNVVDQTRKVLDLLLTLKRDLKALPKDASDEEARRILANLRRPLLDVSKCRDFVVNRGHYFGTAYLKDKDEPGLSDADKRALIEFLKTF